MAGPGGFNFTPQCTLESFGVHVAYGLPGLRVGWIACRDRALLERLEKRKHYTSICNAGPAEYLAAVALLRRQGEGVQLDVIGSIFAQFDLGAASNDLINADYLIGIPQADRGLDADEIWFGVWVRAFNRSGDSDVSDGCSVRPPG